MESEILASLARASWFGSAAIVLVLALRRPLRKLFGAALAYQAWLLVPVFFLVSALPQWRVPPPPLLVALLHASQVAGGAPPQAGISWDAVLLSAWAAGAAMLALWFRREHTRFVRSLGRLTAQQDIHYSTSPHTGPALLGLWRPKVVVPADFATRYTPREQALIVDHERVHAHRGDVAVNLVQAGLQCLLWFNPLVHVAAVFFRADQELACDAAVIRKHPDAHRSYAEALLKAHTCSTDTPATVACNWRSNHPVKERLMSLQQTQPGTTRRLAGRLILAAIVGAAGFAAVMARANDAAAPQAGWYSLALTMKGPGFESAPRIVARGGQVFVVSNESKGTTWRAEFVVKQVSAAEKTVLLAATIKKGADIVAQPKLLGHLGERMGLSVGSAAERFDLAVVVNETAAMASPAGQ
jgi:beta-lactamase regulating signal transducer with metallopeptidase domain